MAAPSTPPPVGGEEPLPPEHSLPRYDEPTPETHRPISREEEAEVALLNTEFTPGTKVLVTVLFLLTIASLPVINLAAHLRREAHGHAAPGADVLRLLPTATKIKQARSWSDWVSLLPTAAEIKSAEKSLEKESIVSQYLLPRVQSVLTGTLGAGNEQAYPGKDGWLFYRPDVDYVTGPPFLDPARLKQRARDLGIQPDPVKAIVDFKEQMAARGIRLIVILAPAKPAFVAAYLERKLERDIEASGSAPSYYNPSFSGFIDALDRQGVCCISLEHATGNLRAEGLNPDRANFVATDRLEDWPDSLPLYLQSDTHWLPPLVQLTARTVAHLVAPTVEQTTPSPYTLVEKKVTALGDIALMLKLPAGQTIYKPQTVTIQQVQSGNALWRPDPTADVLLLGDSFSNIYSLAAMGWGESAGLAEHISYNLGRPIDCLLRNSDGAFATREMLSRELARGHDRLAGKKVVIWEFAERELMFGDWKMLSLALGQPKPATFYSSPPKDGVVVTATVTAVSTVPRPGSVPYKDHILSVHLEEIEGAGGGNTQAIAFLWSMRNSVWTPAARWRPGDRVKLRLSEWPGAHPERASFNHSELDDPALQLEEPVWAEPVE